MCIVLLYKSTSNVVLPTSGRRSAKFYMRPPNGMHFTQSMRNYSKISKFGVKKGLSEHSESPCDSGWGRLCSYPPRRYPALISIHAPREGSDTGAFIAYITNGDFNPRSPRRERPCPAKRRSTAMVFQSTLPAKGATALHRGVLRNFIISIHAPREGSDASGALDASSKS